jgi:16S rRNA (adenine1518-N6/adenine1519-N6)-dimethyltransferase
VYGQNFLTDPNLVRRIVDVANVTGRDVVEIGAGTGTLTLALAAVARRVVAYEIDLGLVPVLTETLGSVSNVDVRFADAVEIDLGADLATGSWVLVANLPYNVGTGIILDALRSTPTIERIVVTVQSEVAERLTAEPGSKIYGLPSVVVALHAAASIAFTVPPHVFEPQPKVDSSVVVIDRIEPLPHAERAIEIAAAAFGQRRKMLRRSLASLFDDPTTVIASAGIDPASRPEQLSAMDYVALATVEEST